MAKSGAERSRLYQRRKREWAREAGLCYTCCKRKPDAGLIVCGVCNAAAVDRKKRKRQRDGQTSTRQEILAAHERAGDVAQEHHFYAASVQHYQDALQIKGCRPFEELRITQKLVEALSSGNEPNAATAPLNRLLAMYKNSHQHADTARILLKLAHQAWLDSRTNMKRRILEEAIREAKECGDRNLLNKANLRMANTLSQLGCKEEAFTYLNAVTPNAASAEPLVYWGLRAALTGVDFGKKEEAFACLERGSRSINRQTDLNHISVWWGIRMRVAWCFSKASVAKAYQERALLAARQAQVVWLIVKACTEYAFILMQLGHYSTSREYLLEALSSNVKSPTLDDALVYVGITLGLRLNDRDILKKCIRLEALERAFASGEPARVALVSTGFARLYVERRELKKARVLLHRALDIVKTVDTTWDFAIEVARSGSASDFLRARRLLSVVADASQDHIANAYLALFDAFVARRNEQPKSVEHAKDALRRFKALGWHADADLVSTLLPAGFAPSTEVRESRPFADLTPREQEIAELVLRGLTSREIATELAISRFTVDSHVNSIMSRLGIRSRHQLTNVLAEPVIPREAYP